MASKKLTVSSVVSLSDLVVGSITAPLSVVQGSVLAFSYMVQNLGTVASGAHYVGIGLDVQPSEASYKGFNAVGALGAAGSQMLSNSFSTAGLSLGTHTLYLKEDFWYNAVAESNEANNLTSFTFTVTATGTTNRAPVLAVAMPDQTWREGTASQYTLPTTTFTDPDGNALTYSASLSTGAALPIWLSFNASTRTFSGTAPAGSPDYAVRVVATDTGGLSTFDDVGFVTPAVVASLPDLVVGSISAPASVVQGSALVFSYMVQNLGTMASGAHYVGIGLDVQPSEASYKGFNAVGALGAAGSQMLSNSFSTAGLSVGTHTLYLKEDFWYNAVAESNEANNLTSVTFTVTAPGTTNRAPVLAVALPDQTWREGNALQYTVPTTTFTDPDGNALTYSASLSTGAALPTWLSFNASTRVFSGTAPAGSPDYTVRVKAMDAGGLSTFDDVGFVTAAAAVVSLPDLVVGSITAPASVVQGGYLTFSYQVFNQGTGASGAHEVGAGVDQQPSSSYYITGSSVAALGAAATQTFTNGFSTAGLSVGTHTLYLKEDFFGDKVVESDETNNVRSVTFTVTAPVTTAPDLVVGSITAPLSVVQGSALAFSYVVQNLGTVASGAHYVGIGLDVQPSEASYKSYNAVGALGAAGSQMLSNSFSTAGLSVGTHTLYLKEDFWYNTVAESDETNNVKSVTFTVTAPVAANRAPVVALPLVDQNWSEGTLLQHTVPATTFTDPDGNALTYSAALSTGAALPTWLSFNASTRTFSGTAPAGSPDYAVRVKAMDAGGLSTFDDVSFFTPAVVASLPDLVVGSITAPASVVQGGNFAFSYIALNQGQGTTAAHYVGIGLDVQPSEASYKGFNAVGVLGAAGSQMLSNSFSTAGLSVGTHTLYLKEDFWYNAVAESNETNNVTSLTFTVTAPVVVNHAPVVAAPMPDQTWSEGNALQYTVPIGTFTDPDGNALTYSASLSTGAALPTWLSFNASTRVFSGTAPAGSPDYTVRVKAMDAGGLSTFDDVGFVTTAATSTSGFSITLSYTGDSTYAPYFEQAKAIWEQVITGDLPDIAGVDDLLIAASVAYIDGPYNVMGQAGPTDYRSSPGYLPYKGDMEFDSADMAMMLADGTLVSVITHEMGHVLGFGSIWDLVGLNTNFGQYTGAAALAEYQTLSGNAKATYVPLETGGGGGTADSHWSETVFNAELMTGYVESSVKMPLSRLTVAAMQDLGYTINFAAADSYAMTAGLVGIRSDISTVEVLRVV